MGLESEATSAIVTAGHGGGQVEGPDLGAWPRRAEGILEVPFDALGRLPDALAMMRARSIDGLVVPDFYGAAEVAEVTARFWAKAPEVPHEAPYGKPPQVFCRPLTTTADADEYHRHAPILRDFVGAIFEGLAPFEARLEAAFTALAGGRVVGIPEGPDGRVYSPATLRTLPPGHRFAPHFGNQFLFAPTCAHLRSLMQVEMHLSYFTPLAAPASGGELELFPIEWSEVRDGQLDGVPVEMAALFVERRPVPLSPGELVIFDGSRILHAIRPVGPGPVRVTLGGFLGFTADDGGIVYWS